MQIEGGSEIARSPCLVDTFGRQITYVRLSVTDRCDLRCRYCMSEEMRFLPRRELLTIEELDRLADIFIATGVRRIRLTGGEPLVRRGIDELVRRLGAKLGAGLEEVTLTTNGMQLAQYADVLSAAGVQRINVSLDSLDPDVFRHVTRRGDLARALRGIAAARHAGLTVKINMVALRDVNENEIERMLRWCAAEGHDLTLIETMPLGAVEEDRTDHFLPLDVVKRRLEERFDLIPSSRRTGGPARYYDVPELGVGLGLISPLTRNFCAGCNRIRVTATGTVYGCLGHDQKVELRDILRTGGGAAVDAALRHLVAGKPEAHQFDIAAPRPAVDRHMSVTGG